jgi:hypothetical protein
MLRIRTICFLACLLAVILPGGMGAGATHALATPLFPKAFHPGPAQLEPGRRPLSSAARRVRTTLAVPVRNPLRLPNIRLSAVLGPGAKSLTEGLSWRIEKRQPDESTAPQLVWSGGGASPELTLKPGRYYAEVAFGLARNGLEFEVPPDRRVAPVVSLDAGTLHVHAAATPGGAPLDDVFFTLRKAETGGETPPDAQNDPDNGDAIGRSSLPNAVFHVPAGRYSLITRHGLASVETPIVIAPGQTRQVETITGTGDITLSAHAKADGPPLSGATFFVFENGEAGQHKEILRSRLGEPKFTLPAGHYRFAAVIGLARIEEDIRIEPGDAVRRHLDLKAGGVRLRSVRAHDGAEVEQPLLYRIYDLSGENGSANQEIFRSTRPSPTIFLPSGRYRIESQLGWHNARQAADLDVAAGDVASVDFKHKACDVTLRLVTQPGGAAVDRVKWTLKYNGGGTVLISQDAAPSLVLQAGTYQAVAQHGAKTYTHSFEAVPDQKHLIEVVAE